MTALDCMFIGQRSNPVTCAQAHGFWRLLLGKLNALLPSLLCWKDARYTAFVSFVLGATTQFPAREVPGAQKNQKTQITT